MSTCTRPIQADAAACAISLNPLLRDLPADTLTHLLRNVRRVDSDRGHSLSHPGKPVDFLYLVLSGTVSRSMLTDHGVERVLELYGPNDMCGLAELFSESDTPIQHLVVEPSVLIAIPMRDMRSACERSPALVWRIASHLAQRQQAVEDELVSSQLLTANDRVLNFLQSHCRMDAAGDEASLILPASKQLVAARLGMTPESFSRALRELANADLIVNQGRTVLVRRPRQQRKAHSAVVLAPRRGSYNLAVAPSPRHAAPAPALPLMQLINLSGRQRMLSERMAKTWMMIGRNISPVKARRLLRQSISLYEQQRKVLAGICDKPSLSALLHSEAKCWPHYRKLLLDRPNRERMDELLAANADIVDIAERATYELTRNPNQDGPLINLAGRQRMLVQRLAKNFLCKPWFRNRAEFELAICRDREAFASELERLAGITLDLPEVQIQLGQVRLHWLGLQQFFTKDAQAIDDQMLGVEMAAASERLVDEIDAAVTGLVSQCTQRGSRDKPELMAA